MPEIEEAKLNFAAAKLTIVGSISEEILQTEARKIEPVTLYRVDRPTPARDISFWEANQRIIRVGMSGLLLIIGWLLFEKEVFPWAQLFLLSAILIGGFVVGQKGFRNLLKLNFDMNVLMTVAVTGAVLIGEWEEAAVVTFLFALSELLESYSMDKARRSIRSLMEISPREATVIRNVQEFLLPVEELIVGDILLIRPGEKVPMDGTVIDGFTSINQAAITGESIPAEKQVGDPVFAGTLNQQGAIRVRVDKLVQDTTLARIIHLVEEAQAERAPYQSFVDRFAKYYTPAVIVLAVLIALLPPLFQGGNWSHWFYEALALLVVACPCALVVSTPVAIVTAVGTAAKHGVLIKGGLFLEQAAAITAIAFDKTGTLTEGEPKVTDILPIQQIVRNDEAEQIEENRLLEIAGSLEALSEHPLARSILSKVKEKDITMHPVEGFRSLTGKGASGVIQGELYFIGNLRLFEDMYGADYLQGLYPQLELLQQAGKTIMLVGNEQRLLGIIAAADPVRQESAMVVHELKQLGVEKTVLLSGDHALTAGSVAKSVQVDEYYGELLPEDKLEKIRQLRHTYGQVAMVGDGMNDAPALATANLGIAMGGAGTDTALETADIVLMGDDLTKLPVTVRLSRSTLRVIKQNISFALLVKLAAILLVFPGWLTLWLAIMADMGATILVTLNGLRLLKNRDV